jgi:putative membrane protein
MLTEADHDRIRAAIAQAEAKTTGEIFCVVAKESATYRDVVLAWAAGVALAAPPLALALGVRPFEVLDLLQSGWRASGEARGAVTLALVAYACVQAVLFALVGGLASIPAVRRRLTPRFVRSQHVHARAMEQFAHRLHATRASTGILIYASLAERQVEIIADEAIHKKVETGAWDKAVAAALGPIGAGDVAGGMIAAIGVCGQALAEHFPRHGGEPRVGGEHLAEV